MTRLALLVAMLVSLGLLVLVIDAQSRVPVERPARVSRPRVVYAAGRVEGATPEIELRLELRGRIQEVLAREGQLVAEGEALVRLEDDQYRHEVSLAEADLALANAELERLANGSRPEEIAEADALYRAKSAELPAAERTLKRMNELLEAKAVSEQMADDQQTLVDSLTAQAEAAKARLERLEAGPRREEVLMAEARAKAAAARLELAKVQLARTVLRAPCRLQILEAEVEPGELTGPDAPVPAIVAADTSEFRVRAFVEEQEAPRVPVGALCEVTADGLPGRELEGRVAELSPRMSAKRLWSDDPGERFDTKTREVWVDLHEPADLVVGLRVDVTIHPDRVPPDPYESPPSSAPETPEVAAASP